MTHEYIDEDIEKRVVADRRALSKAEIFGTRYGDAEEYRHHEVLSEKLRKDEIRRIMRIISMYRHRKLEKPVWLLAVEVCSYAECQTALIEFYYRYIHNLPVARKKHRKHRKITEDEKEIIAQLYKSGYSIPKIAQIVRRSTSQIHRVLKEQGLAGNIVKHRKHRSSREIEDRVIELWRSGMSTYRIAKELGRSVSTVHYILKKHGLK